MPQGKGKPAGGYHAGKKGSHGCKGYPTISADGTVHGCHPTKTQAAAQARAIWASVNSKKFDFILEKAMVSEGDFVIVSGEEDIYVGIVEYVMTNGTFGRVGSDFAIEATQEDPAVLVRTLEFEEDEGIWQEEDTLVGSPSSMLTIIAPLPLEVETVINATPEEIAMAMYDASIGKSECCPDEVSKKSPCWEGYVQRGMKPDKNGKMVPNCVPVEKTWSGIFDSPLINRTQKGL